MNDLIFDEFQNSVEEALICNKSILDILTKLQDSQSRINRAVAKAVTSCGCVEISAKKQQLSENEDDFSKINQSLETHLNGKVCESCRDVIENEIGNNLFYLTSLCNLLDINLYDVLIKENNKITTFGKYNLL